MKKIFTLLFFVGLLSSAFAQQDYSRQYGNQTNDHKYQSHHETGDNSYASSRSHDDHGYYDNDSWNNRDDGNDYGYHRGRGHYDRDNMRRDQHPLPNFVIVKRPFRATIKIPLLQIVFGGNDDCN